MKRYMIFNILLLTVIGSCKPEPPEPPLVQPGTPPYIEIIWSKSLNNQANNYPVLQPIFHDNILIIGAAPPGTQNQTIYGFEKQTGQKLWEWNDYLSSDNNIKRINKKDNKGIISNFFRDYVFDMQSGTTIWRFETPSGVASYPRGSVINDYIYHSWDNENVLRDSVAWLMRSRLDYPHWDTVVTLHSVDGYSVFIEPPVLWMSPSNDSVLIFQNRSISLTTNQGRIDLLAFNLNSKTFNWRLNHLSKSGESSVYPPIIYNNTCIFFGDHTVYSVNLVTGQKAWEYDIQPSPTFNNLMSATAVIGNNKLYIKTAGKYMFCLDPNSGHFIWENLDAGYSPSQLIFYKNKVYYMSSHKIYCVDSNSGQVLYSFDSPNENHSGNKGSFVNDGGLVIDPSTNLMYFADSYYATCIKVPE